MKKLLFTLLLVVVLGVTPAFAKGDAIYETANSDNYLYQLGGGILLGVQQVLESPVHLIKGLTDGVKNAEPSLLFPSQDVPGFLMGTIKGIGIGGYDMLENIVAGAGNLVSSIVPVHGPIDSPNTF